MHEGRSMEHGNLQEYSYVYTTLIQRSIWQLQAAASLITEFTGEAFKPLTRRAVLGASGRQGKKDVRPLSGSGRGFDIAFCASYALL